MSNLYVLRKGVATLSDLADGLLLTGGGNLYILANSTDSIANVSATSLAAGVALLSAGDILAIMPGYTETLTAAVTVSVAGVKIIGLGEGSNRPTLTVSGTIDGINVTGAGVVIENIIFATPGAAATSNINLAATDDTVRGVSMTAGANFDYGITVTAAGERPTIEYCDVTVTANGPVAFIDFEGVIDRPIVRYNVIIGSDGTNEFDNACIDFSGQVITNPVVMYNIFEGQGDATPLAAVGDIGSLVGACIAGNIYAGGTTNADNVATITAISLAADSITSSEIATGAIDQDALAADTILGANNADNAFASGSVAGNVDGSIIEREEWLQVELAKVPKSDSTATWNATALASIQTEANDALVANNLDHYQLLATTDITDPVDMTAEVVDNTVLAHVITDDGDVSDYDRRYMSLEALAKLLQIEFGYQLKSVAGSAMPIAIWYVDANISASGDGKTPATAFKTLAEAITACSNSVDDWVLVYDYSGGGATVTIDKAFVHIIGNANVCMPYPRIKPASAVPGFTLGDSADRVEIANLIIGGGDQTVAAILIDSAAGAYGVYIHDCVIGRDADAPGLYGVYVPSGSDAPYLTVEHNKFYGSDGAGIAAAGSAIRIAGNATRCNILDNYIQDVGRTATPAIWLDGSVTSPRVENNRIKTDTDTGTGSAITLGAGVDDGWIAGNLASDGKDAPAQNPFVDGAATNGWSQNYSGIVAVLPA